MHFADTKINVQNRSVYAS